jgi:hypothetical protein
VVSTGIGLVMHCTRGIELKQELEGLEKKVWEEEEEEEDRWVTDSRPPRVFRLQQQQCRLLWQLMGIERRSS